MKNFNNVKYIIVEEEEDQKLLKIIWKQCLSDYNINTDLSSLEFNEKNIMIIKHPPFNLPKFLKALNRFLKRVRKKGETREFYYIIKEKKISSITSLVLEEPLFHAFKEELKGRL